MLKYEKKFKYFVLYYEKVVIYICYKVCVIVN